MLLWKSGKQSVVSASTAEAELVEILEGALAGDAVRVVLEEALDTVARAVSFTQAILLPLPLSPANQDHGGPDTSKSVPTS